MTAHPKPTSDNAELLAHYEAKIQRLAKVNEDLLEALKKIDAGEGVYGAQAHEYKQIARAAIAAAKDAAQ